MKERTYFMIKPGFADNKKVIMAIVKKVLENGYQIKEFSFVEYNKKAAQLHYAEHFRGSYENAKSFYIELEDYITSGKALAFVIEGENARTGIKTLCGSVNPNPGTIRYEIPQMLGMKLDMTKNVVHSSGREDEAENEISIFEKLKKVFENKYEKENKIVKQIIEAYSNDLQK